MNIRQIVDFQDLPNSAIRLIDQINRGNDDAKKFLAALAARRKNPLAKKFLFEIYRASKQFDKFHVGFAYGAPRSDLRHVLTDEYGDMYADPNGYMWRGPDYKARYDLLGEADKSGGHGGWTQIKDWYKSVKASDEYGGGTVDKFVNYAGRIFSPVARAGLILAVAYGATQAITSSIINSRKGN